MTDQPDDFDINLEDITGSIELKQTEEKEAVEKNSKNTISDALKSIQSALGKVFSPDDKEKQEEEENIEVLPLTPEDKEKQDYENCIKRLTEKCKDTYICIPSSNKIFISNLEEATGEDFMNWLNYIWPSLKGKHKSSDYEKLSVRKKAHSAMIELAQSLKIPGVSLSDQYDSVFPKKTK